MKRKRLESSVEFEDAKKPLANNEFVNKMRPFAKRA